MTDMMIMINIEKNHWVPSEGYKYITNGEIYTDGIFLGRFDNISNWHDTNDEPPEAIEEPEITEADKASAFDIIMGEEE